MRKLTGIHLVVLTLIGCVLSAAPLRAASAAEVSYVASVHPLGLILRELCAGRAEVNVLIPAGASPHTYDPKPSDAKKAAAALALFYVSDSLDAWATELDAAKKVEVLAAVPDSMLLSLGEHFDWDSAGRDDGHAHGEGAAVIDPHFWLDPLAVKATIPALVKSLSAIDPAGASTYKTNGDSFVDELDELDTSLNKSLAPIEGESLLMFHPAFQYMARRYGLRVAGAIEPFPGREPTPKYIAELLKTIKAHKVKALFTEPQLPPKPAEALAEATGLPLFVLDPNGGVRGRSTYAELLRYNAETLLKGLGP